MFVNVRMHLLIASCSMMSRLMRVRISISSTTTSFRSVAAQRIGFLATAETLSLHVASRDEFGTFENRTVRRQAIAGSKMRNLHGGVQDSSNLVFEFENFLVETACYARFHTDSDRSLSIMTSAHSQGVVLLSCFCCSTFDLPPCVLHVVCFLFFSIHNH